MRNGRSCRSRRSSWVEATTPPLCVFDVFAPFHQPIGGDRLFIDAILASHSTEPGFADGWKAQQVVDAASVSHREGRWTPIS